MSVISKLKDAILKKDWELVDLVLQDLAGITVEQRDVKDNPIVPKKLKNNDEPLNKFMVNPNVLVREKTDVVVSNKENIFYDDKTLDMVFIILSTFKSIKINILIIKSITHQLMT